MLPVGHLAHWQFSKTGVLERLGMFVLRGGRCRLPHNKLMLHREPPFGRPAGPSVAAHFGVLRTLPQNAPLNRSAVPGVMRLRRFF